jgi:CxxC motif-containing protein
MELICILCPNGCHLTVEKTADGYTVTGNKCPKGETYGINEVADPRRVITAVVRTTSDEWPTVPVKSARPVAKKHINSVLRKLYAIEVTLPVKRGEECLSDADGMRTPVVFTRTLPPPT